MASNYNDDKVKEVILHQAKYFLDKKEISDIHRPLWESLIREMCVKELESLRMPFTYTVTCKISKWRRQKTEGVGYFFWPTDDVYSTSFTWRKTSIRCEITVHVAPML